VTGLEFLADGRLLTAGVGAVRVWDVERMTSELLRGCTASKPRRSFLAADRVRSRFLSVDYDDSTKLSTLSSFDLQSRTFREITSHGNRISAVALDSTGMIAVTGDFDGVVRVGAITGEDPHLLFGHTLEISSVAVSPDGKWIASGSQDGTIRLWPMPEGTPFHTLPYEEILKRLRSFTNLRVVPDESSDTGYRVVVGPFPGWKTLPAW
jgi:WD40 repeat protein